MPSSSKLIPPPLWPTPGCGMSMIRRIDDASGTPSSVIAYDTMWVCAGWSVQKRKSRSSTGLKAMPSSPRSEPGSKADTVPRRSRARSGAAPSTECHTSPVCDVNQTLPSACRVVTAVGIGSSANGSIASASSASPSVDGRGVGLPAAPSAGGTRRPGGRVDLRRASGTTRCAFAVVVVVTAAREAECDEQANECP